MSQRKPHQSAVVIQLNDYDRSLGIDELNLCEFPVALLATRNDSGQNTLLFEDTIFDESRNQHVERSVVISGSDHFGLPTSTDSDILLLLVHVTNVRNGFQSKRVEFSTYELVKFLRWPDNGQSVQRVHDALMRWASVTLQYKHAWWQKSRQEWKSRSFHVIESLELHSRDELRDEGRSWFTWNDVMFESFQAGNLKRIDLGVYFQLKSAVAKQIYRFLDKRFYKKRALEFDLRTFGCEHIGLSRRYDCFELKRKLTPALRELEAIGFLQPRSPAERFQKIASGKWTIAVARQEKSKTTQETRIEKELIQRGVHRKVAGELAAQFPAERIEDKLRLHDALLNARDRRISRNPAGFLTAAIRHDYQSPPPEKPRRAPSPQIPRETDPSRPTRHRDITASPPETSEQKAFTTMWHTLSLEEQARLERDALHQASRFHRDTLKRLEAAASPLHAEIRLQIVRDFWAASTAPRRADRPAIQGIADIPPHVLWTTDE